MPQLMGLNDQRVREAHSSCKLMWLINTCWASCGYLKHFYLSRTSISMAESALICLSHPHMCILKFLLTRSLSLRQNDDITNLFRFLCLFSLALIYCYGLHPGFNRALGNRHSMCILCCKEFWSILKSNLTTRWCLRLYESCLFVLHGVVISILPSLPEIVPSVTSQAEAAVQSKDFRKECSSSCSKACSRGCTLGKIHAQRNCATAIQALPHCAAFKSNQTLAYA